LNQNILSLSASNGERVGVRCRSFFVVRQVLVEHPMCGLMAE
jgi:hypothetical protein